MARPRKQDQFAAVPENDCDERIMHIEAVHGGSNGTAIAADLEQLSALLGLMADPTRLRIVAALDAVELCVCDLSATIGISESAVSHQLRQMRELNVVRGRRDGRRVFYSLNDEHVMSIYRQARDHVGHGLGRRRPYDRSVPFNDLDVEIGGLDCADCAKTLERRLTDSPGVSTCVVRFDSGTADIAFDPELVTEGVLRSRIRELGYAVGQTSDGNLRRGCGISGIDCADCARTLQASVASLPGVESAEVAFGTGMMQVFADRGVVPDSQIQSTAERLGYRVEPQAPSATNSTAQRTIARRTWEIVIAAALVLVALALSAFTDLQYVPPILHVIAAAIAGYPVARAALVWIKVRRADMNLLMAATAAVGALALQDWAEASTLMVLFAIGLALQSATIDRTRGAIRQLMSIAPATARVIQSGQIETIPGRKPAAARAGVAEDHERGRAAVPAVADVRAGRLLADRVQALVGDPLATARGIRAAGPRDLEPGGLARAERQDVLAQHLRDVHPARVGPGAGLVDAQDRSALTRGRVSRPAPRPRGPTRGRSARGRRPPPRSGRGSPAWRRSR